MKPTLAVSPVLSLPSDTVTQTIVVYGGKGMGKTNFSSVLAEELAKNGMKFSVIDPLDVWWGLQHGATRGTAGIEVVILGGPHGDIPIHPAAGAVVADFVVDEPVSTVVVLRNADGTMWSAGERIRFVTDYCTRLFARQGERRVPLMQFIDEAGRFVPQTSTRGDLDIAKCIGAIENLVEWGRNVAVGVCLITQRSARMAKSVSELAECMVAFRTVGPNSIAAVADWLGEYVEKDKRKELVLALRALPRGTALVVSPGWLEVERVVGMRLRTTFDSSKTPEHGSAAAAPPGAAAKPDLAVYRNRMAAVIESAKDNDPKWLRGRIDDLEREVIRLSDAKPEARVETVKVSILEEHDRDFLRGLSDQLHELRVTIEPNSVLMETLQRFLKTAATAPQAARPAAPPARAVYALGDAQTTHTTRAAVRRQRAAPAADAEPTTVAQRVLDGLAELEALGVMSADRELLCFFAGYGNPGSRPFRDAVADLLEEGAVEFPASGKVGLTERGRGCARRVARPSTNAEMHERIIGLLKDRVVEKVLRHLLDVHPEPVEREVLANVSGYGNVGSRPFRDAIARLKTLGFVRFPSTGTVVADALLFPRGGR